MYSFAGDDQVNCRDASGLSAIDDGQVAALIDRWDDHGWFDQNGGYMTAAALGLLGIPATAIGGPSGRHGRRRAHHQRLLGPR